MVGILPHSASFENSAYFAAHLHTRSGFSYGQGVAYPDELVRAAVGLGYECLALTDRDGMYGVPKFLAACAEYGISPIVGAEITVERGKDGEAGVAGGERGHLVLLCESMEGYASLCRLITRYRTSRVFRDAPAANGDHPSEHRSENLSSPLSAKERRFPACPLEELLEEVAEVSAAPGGSGLVCLTGALPHGLIAGLVERGKWRAAKRLLYELAEAFGDGSLFVELTDDRTRFSRNMLRRVAGIAEECGMPTVATNEVNLRLPRRP